MALSPGTRLGPYQITAKIGAGGMGEVYKATDTRLDRTVAIKVLPEHVAADPDLKQRFEREAKTISSLNHPHICTLYDIGSQDGIDFLVMEYLEGETLAARIARGPLPLADAVQHMLVLLATLQVLHSHGLVHRDLKPANVFLTLHGLKLLDFGLARPVKGTTDETGMDLTQGGGMLGTPRYMAPEAVRGEATDSRADLFAVGAMLYEMLSGTAAFEGPSAVEIAHAVLHEKPPVLTGSAAIVAADRVIHRVLAKRAEDRYQDAAAMSRDLRGVLTTSDATEPVKVQQVPRLIVLPFRMLRPDEDAEFLAFSLPEAITMSLSGLGSIVVRSTLAGGQFATESPDLKALATHAEVDLVLVGSLLRGGDTLQVNAQLLEAPGGTVVWSERAQVEWQNIFHLQEDLTRRIVGSLAQPLSAKEEQRLRRDVPASATAYELYLRANKLAIPSTPSEWETARDLYLECVEQDPNYAPAWARLGRLQRVVAKIQSRTLTEVEHGYAEAERSFERALSLNPDLAVAHREYAALEIEQGRAREALVRLLARIDADGGNANLFAGLVQACRYCGLLEASLAAHEHARRLDPTVKTAHLDTLACLGRYDEVLEQTSIVDTADFGIRAACLLRVGRDADARAVLDRLLDLRLLRGVGERALRFMRAAVNLDASDPAVDAVFADVDAWKDPEAHYTYACLLARLGDRKRALALLARAVEGGFYCAPAIAQDPWFDPLRADPEFIRLLRLAQTRHRDASAAFTDAGGERLLGL